MKIIDRIRIHTGRQNAINSGSDIRVALVHEFLVKEILVAFVVVYTHYKFERIAVVVVHIVVLNTTDFFGITIESLIGSLFYRIAIFIQRYCV